MRIGVPREIKPLEARVALIPEACAELVRQGHRVLVEAGAGDGSGFSDAAYQTAGATLVETAERLYGEAELVVKVKEPWGSEPEWLRRDQVIFSFLHLAAEPRLTERLRAVGVTAVAFETVDEGGRLPILAPMSDIAGRLAVQIGANLLHRPNGGKGLLLGGMAAAERGHVMVLGAGNAGSAAVRAAAALGANVTVFARKREKQERMLAIGPNVTALYPYADAMGEAVAQADLLIGAVLVPGARTPHLVSAAQVATMAAGSVVVDISVDQGGCIETTRPTTYEAPTYVVDGVVHFGVTNMPGAVPRTASRALCASLFPWVLRLASPDWRQDPALAGAVNLADGEVVHPAVKESQTT
jgi:alanine dehydrogenase